MKNLPTKHPAEVLRISPESLEVANSYLQTNSIHSTSLELQIAPDTVNDIISRPEVKAYINQTFADAGFNNRFKMRDLMDTIIKKKLEELDASDMGSGKDILEILALSHKITMDTLQREIELEKLKQSSIKSQVNVQINDSGSNYGALLERLIGDKRWAWLLAVVIYLTQRLLNIL